MSQFTQLLFGLLVQCSFGPNGIHQLELFCKGYGLPCLVHYVEQHGLCGHVDFCMFSLFFPVKLMLCVFLLALVHMFGFSSLPPPFFSLLSFYLCTIVYLVDFIFIFI